MAASITAFIADEHAIVRRGILQELARDPGISVIGEASSGPAAVQHIRRLRPDVALLDLRLPGLSGIGVAGVVRETGSRVIIFSEFTDPMLVRRALNAGVRGFISMSSDPGIFREAVHEVTMGRRFVDPSLAQAVLHSEEPTLSPREQEILQLIADGNSNAQIAAELDVTIETIKTHVRNILAKFNADNRTEVVAKAMRRSLIQ